MNILTTFFFLCLLLSHSMNSFAQSKIKKIKLGHSSNCIITGDNQLKCWGNQSLKPGQYNEPFHTPQLIDIFHAVKDLEIDINAYSCALSTSGGVKCWGQVPGTEPSEKASSKMPFTVKTPSPAKAITTGGDTVCVLLTNGEVRCLGGNNWDNPGIYKGTTETIPVSLPQPADQIITNRINITVRLIDGSVWHWGFHHGKPTQIKSLNNSVRQIVGGDTKDCFILHSGELKCELNKDRYTTIKGLESNVKTAITHEDSGCAVLTTGQVKCWGFNGNGKIGLGPSVDRSADAVLISGINDAVEVDMENGIACAQLKNEIVKCWGSGFKILGTGSDTFLPPYELKI